MPESMITIANTNAYLAKPADTVKGGLIIVHEIWGLNDHIKDVAGRFAAEGYLSLAPDLLSGTAMEPFTDPGLYERIQNTSTRDEAQKEMGALLAPMHSPEFMQATVAKLEACFAWLADQPETNGRVAALGFCFGGTFTFALAVSEPRLSAAVPFYGNADQSEEELARIKCPVLAFYGEQDTNLVSQLPQLEVRMQAAKVRFEAKVYPDTGHAFFNDSSPARYNQRAAEDSWKRTLVFLQANLG